MANIYNAINKQNERALKKKFTVKKISPGSKNFKIVAKNNRLKDVKFISCNI